MEEITVAELRQNPTAALAAVEGGETYTVTRHRRAVAKLVPTDEEALLRVKPAPDPGPSSLAARPRTGLWTYEETEALLAEMTSDW